MQVLQGNLHRSRGAGQGTHGGGGSFPGGRATLLCAPTLARSHTQPSSQEPRPAGEGRSKLAASAHRELKSRQILPHGPVGAGGSMSPHIYYYPVSHRRRVFILRLLDE